MTGNSGSVPMQLWRGVKNLRTPAPWVIWIFATLVVIGYPVVSSFYWISVQQAGWLKPEADSIAIPILDSFFAAISILAPFVILATVLCTRRTERRPSIIGWNSERPWLSGVASLFLAGPSLLLFLASVADAFRIEEWFELVWIPYTLVISAWLLFLRARLITRD